MIRQIFIVSALNLRNLSQRFWQSMVIVVGLAATIGVLLSMNSLSEGMLKGYLKAGDPGRAIVVSVGATREPASHITRDMAKLISVAPGIAKDVDGAPLADFGINATLPVVRNDGSSSNTTMRGVGYKALKVRPELKIGLRPHVPDRQARDGGRSFGPGAISRHADRRHCCHAGWRLAHCGGLHIR